MNDNILYDEVAKELQERTMVPGLWTRAFSEAGGHMDRARALYIKYRVGQLAEGRSKTLKEERRAAMEDTKLRTLSVIRRFGYALLTFVFGLLTAFFSSVIFTPFLTGFTWSIYVIIWAMT